ncbi:MAG: class I fructose-bisphosphate aldolase family protein [Thermoproteota archaeon]|nr:class I fructose-bisphosphate aldolase family protein [Candidatus Brockarchaeota archaeon]
MEATYTASAVGKNIRLQRILGKGTGKAVVLAMDHGIEHGPKDFIQPHLDPRVIIDKVVKAGVDAIMLPRGLARLTWKVWANKTALIVKVTGKTSLRPSDKQFTQDPIATVKDAVALGADGVAATVYWGAPEEDVMLRQFTEIAAECETYGMPLLNLAYPRGPHIAKKEDVEIVRYAARAAAEVGADIIKTYWTGSEETFREVVRATPIPVMMSGGTKTETPEQFLRVVKGVMNAGGAGVVVGRNVFQREKATEMMRAILKIVHEDASVEEALKLTE